MKMRECISVHIGQTGLDIGTECWQLFYKEHKKYNNNNNWDKIFFDDLSNDCITPRAIFCDLDPITAYNAKLSIGKLFNRLNYVCGNRNTSCLYSTGYYTEGNSVINEIVENIQKETEKCKNLQGFLIYHSLGGGTGSGLGARIIEELYDNYKTKNLFQFNIYPSPNVNSAIVEPYNSILVIHKTIDEIGFSVLYDNEALLDICRRQLDIDYPTLTVMNAVISQTISSFTAPFRSEKANDLDMNQLQTILVPYHRMHYPLLNYAPIMPANDYVPVNIEDLIRQCINNDNQMVKCNIANGRNLAKSFLFRGDTPEKVVRNLIFQEEERFSDELFYDIEGIKIFTNSLLHAKTARSNLSRVNKSLCFLSNNSSMLEAWRRLSRKFDLLFSRKAYLHWYYTDGMEIGEFIDARENIRILEDEYRNIGIY